MKNCRKEISDALHEAMLLVKKAHVQRVHDWLKSIKGITVVAIKVDFSYEGYARTLSLDHFVISYKGKEVKLIFSKAGKQLWIGNSCSISHGMSTTLIKVLDKYFF